jgi:hypothetical protein
VFFLFARGDPPPEVRNARLNQGADQAAARAQMLSKRFLLLALAATVFSLALCALTTNAVPVLLADGFDPMSAATIAGAASE